MNLEVTCNVTTASNYAKGWEMVLPIQPELVNGPFLHDPEIRVPHYVLTKTHCYGYCDDCPPSEYNITNNQLFEQGCLRTEMPNRTLPIRYDRTVPVKAVHLYRNPFDNIVARMHLAVHKRERQGVDVSLFENSRDGFQKWCAFLDAKYQRAEDEFFSSDVLKLFHGLPCHSDWYRYVQWHNHAYILTEQLNLPVHDLFYEDYTHAYAATVQNLWKFLEVEPRSAPIEFYVGKSYESFFDTDHARKAAMLVQALSLPPVWLGLKRYFERYMQ
jgi:Sulfotransferase domain